MNHNEFLPGKFLEISSKDNHFIVKTENHSSISIIILTHNIFRIRYSTDGHFDHDFSYAINNKFAANYGEIAHKILPDQIQIQTSDLILSIKKTDCKITSAIWWQCSQNE